MSVKEVKQAGASTAKLATLVGKEKQFIIDKTTWRPHIMDGSTPGGYSLAFENEVLKLIAQTLTLEQKAQVVKNLEGTFLPLEGGILKGNLHFTPTEQTYADIGYSFEDAGGSLLALRSKDYSATPGAFELVARTDSVNSRVFMGKPTGELVWGNKPVEIVNDYRTEVTMPNGHNQNYIRFNSGLQIVWGSAQVNGIISSSKTVTYTVPFSQQAVVVISNDANVNLANSVGVGWQSSTGFAVGSNSSNANGVAFWIAIGPWK